MKRIIAIVAGLFLAMTLVSCSGDDTVTPKNAQQQAEHKVQARQNYVPKNDVEGNNYNARLKIADDPSTIIWCTAFPTNPNASPVTVPIVGKLTSANKRPYPTEKVHNQGSNDGSLDYNPELPGPDGMYGSSGEYRYGFRPDGVYVDFYGLETFCTSEPSVFQKNHTIIDLQSSGNLNDAQTQAEAALKACRKVNPNPSVPCPAAQNLLTGASK